jgi:epsilon-lactone hydrolase
MPSFTARAVSFILRTTGYYRKLFTGGPDLRERLIALRAQPIAEPTAKMRTKLDIRREEFEGRAVWHIAPKGGGNAKRLLYFHGGGYVYSAASAHWDFLAHMALKHGISSIAPLYPLAPESDARAIADFGLALYRDVVAKHGAGNIVVGGDSAGGGLSVTTARLATEAGIEAPAGLILICPWLDAEAPEPEQAIIEKRDCILTLSGIRDIGPILANGLATSDPLVSPIHGELPSLPPVLMYGGGDDVLVTDARRLKAAQPGIDYREGAGLMHVWPIFPLPEARTAQADMAGFIARVAG